MEYKVNIEARIRCADEEMIGEKERLAYLLEQHGYSVDFIYVTEGAKHGNNEAVPALRRQGKILARP